jgi:DNA polymerase III subunit alpha
MKFSHLHNHTQYSLLDGASSISSLYKKAVAHNMPAVAITDHGNMFGVFDFVNTAFKHKNEDGSLKVKPIVGCEFYVVADRTRQAFTKEVRDVRAHQLLLAKNEAGYKNLVKLCSLGYIEGLYGKYPRIDKSLILEYHEGLIATTCCLGASVPRAILKDGEEAGEKEFKWWLDIFGEDYFVELQRHGIPEQDIVNECLIKWARKYNVKIIASNDSHYTDQEDANAHDILLCVNTGAKKSDPTAKEFNDEGEVSDAKRRFAFYNDQFFFKTAEQMLEAFKDLPEAIDNTNIIVDKVEPIKIARDILLPHFPLPDQFKTQDDYLEFLTWEGAKIKYKIITPEAEERIKFELGVIKQMGFAGYFLIVSDFIRYAKNSDVFVGPGRGSAAGSVVAYLIDITNIDPIKYALLFERFLNPDRASMPDIDTDFDDVGRQKVIDYVAEKYGRNQVAHIVTYGTMAAKSSIKDVARVMDLPLDQSNALAKLVPDRPGTSLRRVLQTKVRGGEDSLQKKDELQEEDLQNIEKLQQLYASGDAMTKDVLKQAEKLEGTVRNTGIHAAGIIIAPTDLTTLIPVFKSKDIELLITQFEGSIIENAGVIKMDFLGLKNLTILKDALQMIKENHGITIVLDDLPLDDAPTFELYQKGATNGTFQFESVGMQKYLKDLKPDAFEDLIAMNALYRPGPLAYIPDFIDRKHGRQPIHFDLPEMEEYLKDTYGITVYQEQVMLLSQKLANFSKGDADVLRKAMGKKQKEVLDKMKAKFIEGCKSNNHPEDIANKVWTDWEAFAQYAFNKSHSTCYAMVAYQTAYLKTHYPSEYMASVLNTQNSIDRITFYMEECRRMNLKVLGPDINESKNGFAVNKEGIIRFGMGAIKGVGEAAVADIISEREKGGSFGDIFDLIKRVNTRTVNKRSIENLIQGGALDSFKDMHRAQYFAYGPGETQTNLEKIIRFGQQYQSRSEELTNSLFGALGDVAITTPKIAPAEEWTLTEFLAKEKEVVGMYITAHPLDNFRFEIETFKIPKITDIKNPLNYGITANVAGFVSAVQHLTSKNGKMYARATIIDYSDQLEIMLFGKDYVTFAQYFVEGQRILLKGGYQKNTWAKEEDKYDYKLMSVMLMEEVKAAFCKRIAIHIPAEEVNDLFIREILDFSKRYPGSTELSITVYDRNNNDTFKFRATRKILFNDAFIELLESLPYISYGITGV